MDEKRLQDWYEQRLPDEELTAEEINWLSKKVFKAVERKVAMERDIIPFSAHKTIQ